MIVTHHLGMCPNRGPNGSMVFLCANPQGYPQNTRTDIRSSLRSGSVRASEAKAFRVRPGPAAKSGCSVFVGQPANQLVAFGLHDGIAQLPAACCTLLARCLFLSTHEPCCMCVSAIVWAGYKKSLGTSRKQVCKLLVTSKASDLATLGLFSKQSAQALILQTASLIGTYDYVMWAYRSMLHGCLNLSGHV